MATYSKNRNLTIYSESKYEGCEILSDLQLSKEYLDRIKGVLTKALGEYPRTFVVRVDLHLPRAMGFADYPLFFGVDVGTRFIESLKAQLSAQYERSLRAGKRAHRNTLRFIKVKEQNDSVVPHYHLALLFNNDAYFRLGDYKALNGNLSRMIYNAWARVLDLEPEQVISLVHFPKKNPTYHLNINSDTFQQDYNLAFRRLSYLAKLETKIYGDRTKNFSCSRY